MEIWTFYYWTIASTELLAADLTFNSNCRAIAGIHGVYTLYSIYHSVYEKKITKWANLGNDSQVDLENMHIGLI